jgi:hypothetical protein
MILKLAYKEPYHIEAVTDVPIQVKLLRKSYAIEVEKLSDELKERTQSNSEARSG